MTDLMKQERDAVYQRVLINAATLAALLTGNDPAQVACIEAIAAFAKIRKLMDRP